MTFQPASSCLESTVSSNLANRHYTKNTDHAPPSCFDQGFNQPYSKREDSTFSKTAIMPTYSLKQKIRNELKYDHETSDSDIISNLYKYQSSE